MIINDGTGTGNQAKVDETNRLYVRAVQATEEESGTRDERAYNLNTGTIALSSDGESGVMYLKNNDNETIHIAGIVFGLDRAVSATAGDMATITLIRNPTGGTLVSNAVNIDMNQNRQFGSANELAVDAYKGVDGDTISGGNNISQFFVAPSSRFLTDTAFMIPKTQTIAIKITPPSGTTSMNVYADIICHLENGD